MVASLVLLARQLVKELMKKEKIERIVMREEEVPELFPSHYGDRMHTSRNWHGLRNVTTVRRDTHCAVCCPSGMRMKEQGMVEHRRSFYEAAGRFSWLEVTLIVMLMSTSFSWSSR